MLRYSWIVLLGMLACTQGGVVPRYPVDPQTGRAIGAREISPEELKDHIDRKTKSLIIDVRDPEAFAGQTIKGAVNIPLDELEAALKNIPKDTALFFT
jgi:3-mercaptopyruvate sulfurtransferase SseA